MKKYINILCVIAVIGFLCFGCKKKENDNSAEKETETVTTTSDETQDIAETTEAVSEKTDEKTNTYNEKETLINPGVGVGDIRLGMAVDKMKEILGEPDYITSINLVYSSLGINVIARDGKNIESIMCGDAVSKNSPFVKACKYRTKEGIGMRTSEEEIISVYGKPTIRRKGMLHYKDRGILFILVDKKVICMWISNPS